MGMESLDNISAGCFTDWGVTTQTLEYLDSLRLLQVDTGAITLACCDLANDT